MFFIHEYFCRALLQVFVCECMVGNLDINAVIVKITGTFGDFKPTESSAKTYGRLKPQVGMA